MRFRDLRIGDEFEFERKGTDFHSMMGPWRKISPRKYVLRLGEGRGNVEHEVGTINVDVVAVRRNQELLTARSE